MTTHAITETLTIGRPQGGRLDAYLAKPAGDGPFPGVVIIHEIFGLNENIRDIARRFAREGYVALAVDLFSAGSRVACMARIFHGILVRPLSNGVVGDLRSALDALRHRSEVQARRLGVIGFCLGGSYALQLACVDEDVRAASVFYGQNPRPLDAIAGACPIVGSYPEKDFTARAARQLEQQLEAHRVAHDIKIYPRARHSFFNETGPTYQAEAAKDAWKRTLMFFEEYLQA